MTRFPRALTLVLALTLTLSTLGCAAKDKHVFVSTVSQPTTLTLLDTYQSEAIWEMDIPVNHNLVLDFEGTATGQSSDGVSPSWVNWKLYRADDLPTDTGRARKGKLISSDRVDLTGKRILMQTHFRPAPEIPGSIDAVPVPVQETAQSVANEAIAESQAHPVQDAEPAQQAVEPVAQEAIEVTAEETAEEAVEATVEEAVEEASAQEIVEEALDPAATQPTK